MDQGQPLPQSNSIPCRGSREGNGFWEAPVPSLGHRSISIPEKHCRDKTHGESMLLATRVKDEHPSAQIQNKCWEGTRLLQL